MFKKYLEKMSEQIYKEIILEHWEHPQNYGVLQNPSIDITDENPLCGDQIHITARVGKTVKEVAFTASGCAVSIASASLFLQEIKNKPITYSKRMKPEDVLILLGITLTPTRTKCALLAYAAFQKGLRDIQVT